MPLVIHDYLLPYVPLLAEREADAVEQVVIHCTELPDLATAREYGKRIVHPSGTGNSGHYYIDRDGTVARYVPGTRVANHVRGHNATTLGIELVNLGRFPHWWDSRHQTMTEPYRATQITALRALLAQLVAEFPHLASIAGHEDLDTEWVAASDDPARKVRRKLDPGPRFPWDEVLAGLPLNRVRAEPVSAQPL